MNVTALMKFDFTRNVKLMREGGCTDLEIKDEIADIIHTGEFFPANIIDCEVVFYD